MFYIIFLVFLDSIRSLKGKTPSEQAEMTIEGNNKWLTLMKTALWYKKLQSLNKN
ncbi:MAG: hypothetical protein KAU84_03130 [Thermoplasmatales archaeon]|nr:hypothetical protein [Thermoplasmatales archaeon]